MVLLWVVGAIEMIVVVVDTNEVLILETILANIVIIELGN